VRAVELRGRTGPQTAHHHQAFIKPSSATADIRALAERCVLGIGRDTETDTEYSPTP
jgi:hypothetical protein